MVSIIEMGDLTTLQNEAKTVVSAAQKLSYRTGHLLVIPVKI